MQNTKITKWITQNTKHKNQKEDSTKHKNQKVDNAKHKHKNHKEDNNNNRVFAAQITWLTFNAKRKT